MKKVESKEGSFHFDEKLSIWLDTTVVYLAKIGFSTQLSFRENDKKAWAKKGIPSDTMLMHMTAADVARSTFLVQYLMAGKKRSAPRSRMPPTITADKKQSAEDWEEPLFPKAAFLKISTE